MCEGLHHTHRSIIKILSLKKYMKMHHILYNIDLFVDGGTPHAIIEDR